MDNKYHIGLLQAISPFSHNVFYSYISLLCQNVVLDWIEFKMFSDDIKCC